MEKKLLAVMADGPVAESVRRVSEDLHASLVRCGNEEEILTEIRGSAHPAVAVIEYRSDVGERLRHLRRLRMLYPDVKFVAVMEAPAAEEETAVRREGIHFLLTGAFGEEVLRKVLARAYEHETTRVRRRVG